MYKPTDYDYEQLSFINFNTTCGMQLDQDNEWIKLAKQLPWRAWEPLYRLKKELLTKHYIAVISARIGSKTWLPFLNSHSR